MNFDIIEIIWEEANLLGILMKKNLREYCIYQAYGDSPIYGREVLLYIGSTNEFTSRMQKHLSTDFERINNLTVRIGRISKEIIGNLKSETETVNKMAEALLITMLKPSYNSSNIKDAGELVKNSGKFLLLNKGERGALPLEVSNYWWKGEEE